jgi:predicted RNA-binding protein with PUA-like domain
MWEGVRNYQARNNLKSMQVGDLCLFYHSNEGKEVVGVARVSRNYYPDPTADKGDERWVVVDVVPEYEVNPTVTLADIKADPELSEIGLLKQMRLSVVGLTETEFNRILTLSKQKQSE